MTFEQSPSAMVYPSFEQFPDEKQLERIKQAYRESFDLARSAYHSMPSTTAYERYLGGTDSLFNLYVFTSLFEYQVYDPNKLFEKMVIWYGSPPDARDDCKDKPWMLGYLLQKPDFPDEYVHLIVCTRTMQLPLISEMSCDKLSDHIDKTFDTLAATLMHEYVHWSALMKRALDTKDPPQRKIHDFEAPKGSDPENGYGAYNAMRIREKHDPTDNADNYAWFALEAFWTRECAPQESYGPPRKGEPRCDVEDKKDLAEDCHAG